MVSGGITPTPTYDANGNQTSAIPATLTWNALNQPITVNSTTATYDALGRMVEKGVGTTYTQFVYNPDGTSLAVYSGGLTKGTISLPGGSTAVYNASGLNYIRHKDWLGSSRLATTWAHAVYAKEAYAPFGETYNEAGTADRSFTGQDQNVVTNSGGTGVYDYLFRKYDPSAGRWLSPDPYGWNAVNGTDPQSLNRYAYVENQPMKAIDPFGLILCISSDGSAFDSGTDSCPANSTAAMDYETVTVNGSELSVEGDGCDPTSNAACNPTVGGVPTYGFIAPSRSYTSTYPSYKGLFCTGDALAAKGLAIGLDAIGTIPELGNAVSAATGAGQLVVDAAPLGSEAANLIDSAVTYGGGIYGGYTGGKENDLFSSASALITVSLPVIKGFFKAESKAIPIAGNIVSGLTGIYDIVGAYQAYSDCMKHNSNYD